MSDEIWENSIIPSLSEFIAIKALSPLFEPDWRELGELHATIDLFCKWVETQNLDGMTYSVHRIEDRSPVLLITVEGTGPGEIVFYSHLDKQPSKPNCGRGTRSFESCQEGSWLFGRGSIDDGYGGYLCVAALRSFRTPIFLIQNAHS